MSDLDAMQTAMAAGVPADVRRLMGENVIGDEPLELSGEERYGFEVCWRLHVAPIREPLPVGVGRREAYDARYGEGACARDRAICESAGVAPEQLDYIFGAK